MKGSKQSDGPDARHGLLEDLTALAGGGVAETMAQETNKGFFRSHLPVHEHRRVLDPDTMLILGGRGTGKSQLFDALRRVSDPAQLVPAKVGAPSKRGTDVYLPGYTTTRTNYHPRPEVLQDCIGQEVERAARTFWVGLLMGVLLRDQHVDTRAKDDLDNELVGLLSESLSMPERWLPAVERTVSRVYHALDRVNETLRGEDLCLYLTYDDLDILATRMTQVYPLVRELLAFWLLNARRWSHLRCKVFLRTDIFNADELAFTDAFKLRPRSVTLCWTPDSLYRLVLKRLLNGPLSEAWREYLGEALRVDRVQEMSPWGLVPTTGEEEHKSAVRKLVGDYMGSDPRRGATYTWFLNHLQDSLGDIAPRSFLKLFSLSADRQRRAGLPRSEHLLEPSHIQGALANVSEDRIAELTKEEYPWIRLLAQELDQETVPMERKDFRRLLGNIKWSEGSQPLYTEPDRLMDYLVSLGIIRETSDHRIHVPDIYLYGFGLKRKGGIRRPRL